MPNTDNHMDDLFRRAAENYPLKTGEGNWDDVAAALSDKPVLEATAGNVSSGRIYFKRLIPILLILMTGGAFTLYMVNREDSVNIDDATKVVQAIIQEPVGDLQKDNNLSEVTRERETKNADTQKILVEDLHSPVAHYNGMNTGFIKQEKKADGNIYKESTNVYDPEQHSATMRKELLNDKTYFSKWVPETTVTEMSDLHNEIEDQHEINLIDRKTNPFVKQKGLYMDFVLGSGYSEVKSQGMTKPGLDAGLRIGYRLNKKISLESGIIFTHKKYYSSGAFFNMDKVESSMPTGMKVMELNGISQLLEVPLKIKYNMPLNKNSNLFSGAGIVSYLMTKEKNNYHTILNGTENEMVSTYTKPARYFAASLNLSLGYELELKNAKSIRIEPYMQIPLQGVGVGSMQVKSTGLRIGYSLYKR